MNYTKKTSSTSINSHKQASGLANHNINPGIIVKSENIKEQSSVRFQRIRCESPEVSVLSNASDRDALSKGFFDNQGSKKRKLSIESSDSDLPLGEEIGKISSSAIDGKKVIATSGPKIVVTAAEGTKLKETVKMTVASVLSLPSIKEKLPLGARIMKFLHIKDRRHTINLVGDQIKKKQMLQEKNANALKMNSGRLLQIISDQALNGKNAEVSKAFKVALTRINPKALQKAHLETLRRKRRSQNLFKSFKRSMKKSLGPYKPDSTFISWWKLVLLTSILIQSFLSTLMLVFFQDISNKSSNELVLIDLAADVVYMLSILFHFRTAYYYHGELRTSSYDIFLNYLTGSFIIDTISMLSLIGRFSELSQLNYLLLLTLLRIYQIPSLIASIEDYFQFNRQVKSMIEVVKLCFVIFILAHWLGCILYAITKIEDYEDTWLVGISGLEENNITDFYVVSLYWAIMTMSTVGYGDITPKSTKERILTIAIMILSSVVFGFLLSSIGSLLMEISAYSSEAREKIRLVNKYMNEKGLSKDIQSKIRKYLEFYLDKENKLKTEGDSIMQLLSQNLKDEIIKEVNAKILNDIYMFSFNFRRKFLYLVSRDFTEKSFGPDDVIFKHNDNNDCSVYFIISGKVEIYYEKSDLSLQHIEKGKSFGFLSFFTGQPRTASARSLEFTTVFILNREKFFEQFEEFHTEKEMFNMIKDSINLYQSYQYLNIKCYSCGSRDHIALKCPKVHFHFNKPKIIVKYLIQEKRFREFYQRRTRKEFKTLRDLEVIQEAATQHQMIQQNELYFDRTKGKEDQTEVRSYSSIDDVMDRNIYDNPPLIYAIDSTHLKTYDFHDIDEHPAKTGHTTPSKKHTKKFQQNKLGEIEAFVSTSYDKYYNNLNIDRVKNFEVYNPNNNIIKIIVDLEKIRLQKIVEMRLGAGGHVVSRLLIKGFRMAERRKQNDVSQSSVGSIRSADAHPEKKVSPVAEQDRRQSLSVNPSDIALYNTGSRKMFAKANDSPTLTSNYTSSEALYSHLKVPNKTKEGILNLALNNSPKDRKRGLSADCSPIHEEKSSLEDHLISTSRRHKETPFNVHSFRRPSISSQGSEPSIRENSQLKINSFINSSRSALSQNQLSNTKDQKLRTAQFGEEEKSHSHRKYNNSYNSFLPSEILKSKHRLSYPVNIYQPDMGRKSILFTDARTNMTENNEGIDNKKPIALFDFTQFVKKMTGKLEENTKSPLSKSISGLSKQTSISSRITPLFPKDKVLKKDQKPLIIEILHQNNKRLGKRKKGRSNSQGKGEEMNNLITKYGLEELISPK